MLARLGVLLQDAVLRLGIASLHDQQTAGQVGVPPPQSTDLAAMAAADHRQPQQGSPIGSIAQASASSFAASSTVGGSGSVWRGDGVTAIPALFTRDGASGQPARTLH